MVVVPWCRKCIPGSGKKKGHTGPHKKFSITERKRKRKEVNRNNYIRRCRRSKAQDINLQKIKMIKRSVTHPSAPITYLYPYHVPIMMPIMTSIMPITNTNIILNNNFINLKPKPIKDICITTSSSHKVSSSSSMENIVNNKISEQDQLEELCFSEFHKHFHSDVHKTYSLNELICIAHRERLTALIKYEKNEYDFFRFKGNELKNRKDLLMAIPDMSTVLGGDPWTYSDSYSPKRTLEIYIYFLSVFLHKHKQAYIMKLKYRQMICKSVNQNQNIQ